MASSIPHSGPLFDTVHTVGTFLLMLCGGIPIMKSVVQFDDAVFPVIVFAQFCVRQGITGILCKRFDLLLDELDEFASKLFRITALHGTPL